jgi:transitional endoplasmic reticulum ATPase
MNNILRNHRFLDKVSSGIIKGYSLFYLYGQSLNDYFFFDYYLGILELKESLSIYFYNIHHIDIFIVIKNNKIEAIDKNGNKIEDLREAFEVKKKISGFGAKYNTNSNQNISKKDQNTSDDASNITDSMGSFDNDISLIEENLDSKKIAIFVDEFEWEANLYGGEPRLDLLRRIRNWDKYKKSFIIINIKEPDLLKEFGFAIDDDNPNMIMVANPSYQEIYDSYKRYIYKQHTNISIIEEEFEDIVLSLKSNNKTLRESFRILKQILSKSPKQLKLSLFEDAISKPIEEKVTFDDIIIDEKIKKDIISTMDTFYSNKENSIKGFILYGPPGTGKTYIVKAIANRYKMNYIMPTLADIKGEFIGQTSSKVKRLFEEARANAPTIIFLDEMDTIFPKRGGSDTDSYLKDMVNQFLVEIDGAKSGKQEIFVIGATNRKETIDSAILSRLSSSFHLRLPSKESRELIFNQKFKNFKISNFDWKNEIIKKTEAMSGRDIDNFVKNILERVDNDESLITKDIFLDVLIDKEKEFVESFRQDMDNSIEIEGDIDFSFKNIIGYENVKEALKNELNYILSSRDEKDKMERFGIKPKRGHLLYGPPGNGKTTFAKALAGEHRFYYIKVLSKDFMGYNLLDIIKKIETIFLNTIKLSKITNKKGIVLFFDEIDALIKKDMNSQLRGTLLSFLEDTKGIKSINSNIILIAATNNKNMLDEASIREGRFDNKIEIKYPTKSEGIKMLRQFFENDEHIVLSNVSNYYEKLYEKEFGDQNKVSSVDLQGVKEKVKLKAFESGSFEGDKIKIQENF